MTTPFKRAKERKKRRMRRKASFPQKIKTTRVKATMALSVTHSCQELDLSLNGVSIVLCSASWWQFPLQERERMCSSKCAGTSCKIEVWNCGIICNLLAGIWKLQNQSPVGQPWMADGLHKLEHPSGVFCQLLSSVAAGLSGGWMGTPEEPQNGAQTMDVSVQPTASYLQGKDQLYQSSQVAWVGRWILPEKNMTPDCSDCHERETLWSVR